MQPDGYCRLSADHQRGGILRHRLGFFQRLSDSVVSLTRAFLMPSGGFCWFLFVVLLGKLVSWPGSGNVATKNMKKKPIVCGRTQDFKWPYLNYMGQTRMNDLRVEIGNHPAAHSSPDLRYECLPEHQLFATLVTFELHHQLTGTIPNFLGMESTCDPKKTNSQLLMLA